jgi:peptide-methionine (S)-S-oxide reductase
MQDLIRKLPGVVSTRVGYTGGDTPNATYRNHGNHAEGIEIVFDTAETSYRRILEYFFQIHDPTTRNRQGGDIGSSYRSAIFYTSDEQRKVAEETIADVNASGLWPGKVVTEVTPVGDFWEAEPEHQDYLERYPNGHTCHFPRPTGCFPNGRPLAPAADRPATDQPLAWMLTKGLHVLQRALEQLRIDRAIVTSITAAETTNAISMIKIL